MRESVAAMRGDDPFCMIAAGKADAYKVYEDDQVMIILDKKPASLGHVLVITKEHYEAVEDVPPDVLVRAWLSASAVAHYLRKVKGALGVNLITNSGSPAGQVVFHFHIHVIPRWDPGPIVRGVRHDLTDEEARRAQAIYEGLHEVIREYLQSATEAALRTQDPPHSGSASPSSSQRQLY